VEGGEGERGRWKAPFPGWLCAPAKGAIARLNSDSDDGRYDDGGGGGRVEGRKRLTIIAGGSRY